MEALTWRKLMKSSGIDRFFFFSPVIFLESTQKTASYLFPVNPSHYKWLSEQKKNDLTRLSGNWLHDILFMGGP